MAISLLENCEFVGSENASMTVEGCPSLDRNWACKHLTMLAKSRLSLLHTLEPPLSHVSKFESQGHLPVRNIRTCEIVVDGDPSDLCPVSQTQAPLKSGCQTESDVTANVNVAPKEEAVTMDTNSSDSERSVSSENEENESVYKLPYQVHSLSHMLAKLIHGRPQANGLTTLQSDYELKTLPQEIQKDKEVQSLVNSVQGCLVWKCLFRDGKGGVFVCSQGQARVEGSIFRDLTYAVRCIQNSKVP